MPSEVEIGLFRVVQEALTNVVRHAGARRICCEARTGDGRLSVVVSDDGCGFDADRVNWPKDGTGCGLEGMRVRLRLLGGTLTVHTASGQGTRVEASVPCPVVEGQPEPPNPDGDEPLNPEEKP
jgi:signal transduction histidine kinase